MLIDDATLAAALHLPPSTASEWEPLGPSVDAPCRVVLGGGGEGAHVVLVRPLHDEAAENHAAVLEALLNAGYPHAPRLLAFVGGCVVEQWVEGVTALQLVPPPGSLEAAVEALAALHALSVREGLRWGEPPESLVPGEDTPLHRLGFAQHEREPAREHLQAAQHAVLASPLGFIHGGATAAHVLLRPAAATWVHFHDAGFGPQLFDVAALAMTSGLEPAGRHALAARYAATRGLPPSTADLLDLAGILWGINELLGLPRRHIEALGDDVVTAWLNTTAVRIERALRDPAGSHPSAQAIRAALWPS